MLSELATEEIIGHPDLSRFSCQSLDGVGEEPVAVLVASTFMVRLGPLARLAQPGLMPVALTYRLTTREHHTSAKLELWMPSHGIAPPVPAIPSPSVRTTADV